MPNQIYRQSFESQIRLDLSELERLYKKADAYLKGEGLIRWGNYALNYFYHSEEASAILISRHAGNKSLGLLVGAHNAKFLDSLAEALPELKPERDRTKIVPALPAMMTPA